MKIDNKKVFIGFVGILTLSILSVLFSFYVNKKQLDQLYNITKQEKIIVINNNGQLFYRNIYQNNNKINYVLSLFFIKKGLGYDYSDIENNIEFIKNITTKKTFNKYLKLIKKDLKLISILKGNYIVKIKNSKILKNNYVIFYIERIYKTLQNTSIKRYIIKLHIDKYVPTENNNLGLFIDEFNLMKYTDNLYKKYFPENK